MNKTYMKKKNRLSNKSLPSYKALFHTWVVVLRASESKLWSIKAGREERGGKHNLPGKPLPAPFLLFIILANRYNQRMGADREQKDWKSLPHNPSLIILHFLWHFGIPFLFKSSSNCTLPSEPNLQLHPGGPLPRAHSLAALSLLPGFRDRNEVQAADLQKDICNTTCS